jgi:hypothetical protein
MYHVAFGALRAHLMRGDRPTESEMDHLVQFCLNGAGGKRRGRG